MKSLQLMDQYYMVLAMVMRLLYSKVFEVDLLFFKSLVEMLECRHPLIYQSNNIDLTFSLEDLGFPISH